MTRWLICNETRKDKMTVEGVVECKREASKSWRLLGLLGRRADPFDFNFPISDDGNVTGDACKFLRELLDGP